MTKINFVFVVLLLVLNGCSIDKKSNTLGEKVEQKKEENVITEAYCREAMKQVTDKKVCKVVINDFDDDKKNEAFVLVIKDGNEDRVEDEYELWFLEEDKTERITESFIGEMSTSIELISSAHNYLLLNIAQARQNDYMRFCIFGVKKGIVQELYSQKRTNVCIEDDEMYAYNGSYYVFEPELKSWMSLSEQKYHLFWDDKAKTCKEYCAKQIRDDEFNAMQNAGQLKNIVFNKINEIYKDKVDEVEYAYLLREDNTIDVNIVVTVDNNACYKYYTTVNVVENSIDCSNVRIFEGNKEKSLFDCLNDKD